MSLCLTWIDPGECCMQNSSVTSLQLHPWVPWIQTSLLRLTTDVLCSRPALSPSSAPMDSTTQFWPTLQGLAWSPGSDWKSLSVTSGSYSKAWGHRGLHMAQKACLRVPSRRLQQAFQGLSRPTAAFWKALLFCFLAGLLRGYNYPQYSEWIESLVDTVGPL